MQTPVNIYYITLWEERWICDNDDSLLHTIRVFGLRKLPFWSLWDYGRKIDVRREKSHEWESLKDF